MRHAAGGWLVTARLIALDPGTRRAGVAWYGADGWPLGARGLLTTTGASVAEMCAEVARALPASVEGVVLVSEWPRKYATSRAAHADLDGLREVVQWVEREYSWAATKRVSPGVWKGNVPKHVHHARIASALGHVADDLDWGAIGPDARDAVALGWWAYRAGAARVFGPGTAPIAGPRDKP